MASLFEASRAMSDVDNWAHRRPERLASTLIVTASIAAAALVWLAMREPLLALGGAVATTVLLLVCAYPPLAAYLMLALTPLIVGVERGGGVVPLRPNEVLLAVVIVGVALRALWEVLHGGTARWRPAPLDRAVLVLTGAAAVLPLMWLIGRDGGVAPADLQYAAVLVKYLLLYTLVRVTIRTPGQVRTALLMILGAASVVASVAIVQTLVPVDMPGWFRTYYAPDGQERLLEIGRGSSTLASSIAVGDHLAFAASLALAWLVKGLPGRGIALALAALFAVGVIASGQFSAIIALVIAVIAAGWVTGSLRTLAAASLPLLVLGATVAWPVLQRRLEGFATPTGVPISWSDRLLNLQTYFFPELVSGGFWLGVRPEARIAAPEAWRDWIWIESGYVWLLWAGGLPLLAAYLFFAFTSITAARQRATLTGPLGVAATGGFAASLVVVVLMVLDPHLTLRGSADLLFPLLALAVVGASGSSTPTLNDRSRSTDVPSPARPTVDSTETELP